MPRAAGVAARAPRDPERLVTLSASPEARAESLREWRGVRQRLQTIRPRTGGQVLLATVAIGVPLWVAAVSWPALLPFVVGMVMAYAVLPLVNQLDRYMPRVLAAVIAEFLAVAVVVGAFVVILPPLVTGVVDVISR